ncbi:hypothetical protein LJC15_04790, partial [Desulfovibrio sp. OttesenSCG-928-G11]|nr:hypothetical protein [Desulfovibrio sp. OttesenSCG-928-G11]
MKRAAKPSDTKRGPDRNSAGAGGLAHRAGHDPRAAALAVLMEVVQGGGDSQAALNRALKRKGFAVAPSDRGLCTELVYGTLRQYLRLRTFAQTFLAKAERLPEEMRLLLLQTLYEMAFLRSPHRATVNWAVSHVRHRFGKSLASVANGALRAMQRSLREFLYDGVEAERCKDAASMARRHGAPLWLAELWLEAYGPENCELLLRASASPPPSGLRLNRARAGWQERLAELGRQEQDRPEQSLSEQNPEKTAAGPARPLVLPPAGLAFFSPLSWPARQLLREGAASRQSMAAYQALEAMQPASWPGPVWDCCAGRGGKSLILLEQGLAVTLASDIAAARLRGLAGEYAALGLETPPLPLLCVLDAADACARPQPLLPEGPAQDADQPPIPQSFGTVLIDAPCSGLGTLARRPEIRLRRSPEDLALLAGLQARILEAVWRRIRSGGCAVYLTCTLNPAENQGQAARFLDEHPEARLGSEFQTPFASPLGEF